MTVTRLAVIILSALRNVLLQHSAEPQALLPVIPSSLPHLNKNCPENERATSLASSCIFSRVKGKKKRPSPCRKCHSFEMNTAIFRGDSCP